MKRVLVVGATSAIANACARIWAARGASLFLVARNEHKLASIAGDLSVRGAASVHCWPMDANDMSAHATMVAAAVAALGTIDVVLVAHGTLPDQAACEADVALAVREFTTNGLSTIALLTGLANCLEQQRHGALCAITSVAGDRGRRSNYLYGSAKAAVSVFCDGLRARLLRSGVSLTDVRPGFVATPMTQHLRLPPLLVAQPDSVGRAIVAAVERRRDVLYAPAFWALIMLVIKSLPRAVMKRLAL